MPDSPMIAKTANEMRERATWSDDPRHKAAALLHRLHAERDEARALNRTLAASLRTVLAGLEAYIRGDRASHGDTSPWEPDPDSAIGRARNLLRKVEVGDA